MAGPLKNPKWELVAKGIASGVNPTKAYTSVYGNEQSAYASVSRLLKTDRFCTRLRELQTQAATSGIELTALTRAWVLESLQIVVIRCMKTEDFQPSGANRALELLGKELGMFVDRTVAQVWNGDVAQLSGDQLAKLIPVMEQLAAEPSETEEKPSVQ